MRKLFFILIVVLQAVIWMGCRGDIPADGDKTLNSEDKIKGVWIATPYHNKLLHSAVEMEAALDELDSLGVNMLFLCTWADNKTIYESEVVLKNSTYPLIDSTSFMAPYNYENGERDVVADLIEKAHERNMKVVFWFEFGFMAGWGTEPDTSNNAILARYPHWAARAHDGSFASYNKADYYFNSYDPEVRGFLLDLINEALEKYPEVDGIQGDDRLPAAPRDSGYDSITIALYKEGHGGENPPADFQNPEWVQWRLNLLNEFAVELHSLVKSKGNYLMAFSPNPYPWCEENLMQQWPAWLDSGVVDLLSVQCYRTTAKSYEGAVNEALTFIDGKLERKKFVPGVILGIGAGKMISPVSLDSILDINRSLALGGESFFYVKWLTEDDEFDDAVKKERNLVIKE